MLTLRRTGLPRPQTNLEGYRTDMRAAVAWRAEFQPRRQLGSVGFRGQVQELDVSRGGSRFPISQAAVRPRLEAAGMRPSRPAAMALSDFTGRLWSFGIIPLAALAAHRPSISRDDRACGELVSSRQRDDQVTMLDSNTANRDKAVGPRAKARQSPRMIEPHHPEP